MRRPSRSAPREVTPDAYRAWRGSDLGSITEARELEVVREVMGDVAGLRVLDLGCGDGIHLVEAARHGALATGIDASTAMLAAARNRAGAEGVEVHLLRADARDLPFNDASFDVVVAVTVLCLVADTHATLTETARVLTPGGRVIVGELGRWNTWAAWRRIRGWAGSSTWRHARFWSARGLADLVEGAGLQVVGVHGLIHYPPVPAAARWSRRIDPVGRPGTTVGAAFLLLEATKPGH